VRSLADRPAPPHVTGHFPGQRSLLTTQLMNNCPQTRKGRPMKRVTRTAVALSGGAAAVVLALAVVVAVVMVVVLLFAAIAPPPTSAGVTPSPRAPAAVAG
jgi:hypothetical protein